ncbi:MAG: hypothetical protein ACFFD2_20125 [Promethearchaeota archaeon]
MVDYIYNQIEGDVILIEKTYKIKGKEYGIIKLNKKQIYIITESIDLISASSISPKFSETIEKYLFPRFNEINKILYTEKSLPDIVGIEISKENQKEIIYGLGLTGVMKGLKDRGYNYNELSEALKKAKFIKSK